MTGPHRQELVTPPPGEPELIAHLARNRETIRNGTALFNGIPITYKTELTRYEKVTGSIIFYKWEYSQFYVYGHESPGSLPRDFIIHSLLWGWWSFPWGPVRTLRAIITNLRGGRRRRVHRPDRRRQAPPEGRGRPHGAGRRGYPAPYGRTRLPDRLGDPGRCDGQAPAPPIRDQLRGSPHHGGSRLDRAIPRGLHPRLQEGRAAARGLNH